MRRRFLEKKKDLILNYKRFFPSGDYTFTIPQGCYEIDLFMVGGGGGGGNGYTEAGGGGSGYTKTYKKSNESSGSYNDWVKDGDSIPVMPGQTINIHVGAGGVGGIRTGGRTPMYGNDGGDTIVTIDGIQYIAEGGKAYHGEKASDGYRQCASGGTGATSSGGWGEGHEAGASFSDGVQPPRRHSTSSYPGISQGHTTRDFGEIEFEPNAGGTSGAKGNYGKDLPLRSTGHTEGSGEDGEDYDGSSDTYAHSEGGAGYGGAGGSGGIEERSGYAYGSGKGGKGGDGTVVIRYYNY